MNRKPRVAIDPEALRALKVWAALEDMEPDALVSKLVMEQMPSKVRVVVGVIPSEAIGYKGSMPSESCGVGGVIPSEDQRAKGPNVREELGTKEPLHSEGCGVPEHSDSKPAKRILSRDRTAIERIKVLWESGEHNAANIARQIGYDRRTVWENIKRMKERGELQEVIPIIDPAPEPEELRGKNASIGDQ